MAWRVEIKKAIPAIQPPDDIIIRNTEGLGTWKMTRPEAVDLYRTLGRELGYVTDEDN